MDTKSQVQVIRNIIKQVQETDIDIGRTVGHYISTSQVHAVVAALNTLDSPSPIVHSPDNHEHRLRDRREEIESRIRSKQAELELAPRKERKAINEDIGTLQSSRANIDKALAKLLL